MLGFYRDQNQIQPVYSSTPVFKDRNMSSQFEAKIMPLQFNKTESEWVSLPNFYNSHPLVDHIIKENLVFHTSPDEAYFEETVAGYQCGALLHIPVDDPAMTRTGVLVYFEDNVWKPVLIYHNDVPFLLECKGVGSGIGNYVSIHSRTQAGTSKTHQRVTGGMAIESVEKEFKNLMTFNSFYGFEKPSILPFACVGFEYTSDDLTIALGLVLRLTPSNIRYSFTAFGEFQMFDFVDRKAVYPILKTINEDLFRVGMRHQNLNSNNLCFAGGDTFVVTDFEEIDSIYQVPPSLDSETDDIPMYLKIYPFRYIHRSYYDDNAVSMPYDTDELRKEISSGFARSHDTLSEYHDAAVRFLGTAYFDMPLLEWVKGPLTSMLTTQRQCLIDFKKERRENANVDFTTFIQPYLESLGYSPKDIAIGDFNIRASLAVFFLFPHNVSAYKLSERIVHIESLLRHIDRVIFDDSFFVVEAQYATPFLYMDAVTDYWDLHLLMFPFLQSVSHWHYFLKTNFYKHDVKEAEALVQRLDKDLTNVTDLYQCFKASRSEFVKYLTKC